MNDINHLTPTIERVHDLAVVSLKVAKVEGGMAAKRLSLASPRRAEGEELRSLWIGPDEWLLVSCLQSPQSMIDKISNGLGGMLFHAVNQSDSLCVFRIAGVGSRQLLASGCGIDLRAREFMPGACCRTRLAQLPTVIFASHRDQFELYIDRSYATYLSDWLEATARINGLAIAG